MAPRALRNLASRPATRRYPAEVRPRFEGARGKIEFDVETCNYCMLCARRCPTLAITVSREERTWAIEHLTCIACNACVDVCAKKSLRMSVEARRVQTPAGGADGRRPGREEWHGPAPEAVAPSVATTSEAPAS
jgi:formate hydrogenlyase subunit 6/NADH:ubiquinone oxidoreductase subunit I